ncbi:uncharacterized protein C17orf80 homolog isoform X2 [Vidua chalybeata]|uniref:uncharacterized protein C17orf80 homolog isoform X2 n=1 Tax=Vidua chalybeata TaxID=81927 RepID=UPI0023A866FF|nr:uncharacterized protein C17orf80 homolog isoform X2 [Vidua chalybeata]
MAAAGPELCPHCRRPFKRLRAHLPHCKAAPAAPRASPQPSAVTGGGPAPSPAPAARPAPGSGSRAVRDVARSLDLHPEEVEDVPKKLQKGVKVVIEKHRARVVREKEPRSGAGAARGRGEGTEPGPAPAPQRRKTAPKSKGKETRSRGAVGNGTGSSEGEKSGLKAAKTLQEPAESRDSPGDLVRREGRDKTRAGGQRVHLEVGAGSEPPAGAWHPGILHPSPAEALGGGGQGTSRKELSLQGPRAGGERVPEPLPSLALLHTLPKTQPTSSRQAPGSSARAGATGLEWFPDLYPDWEGLRIFPGKRFHEDVRIAAETPKGGLARGQQAWSSYCAKYIHVKQGGPAGISMLLAGYCLLSYGWNYQHLKRHRWRKYH